jgi:hypothetical protein
MYRTSVRDRTNRRWPWCSCPPREGHSEVVARWTRKAQPDPRGGSLSARLSQAVATPARLSSGTSA